MRTRVGILALTFAAVLSACSSDSDPESGSTRLPTPTASLTEITVPCDKFEDTANKITKAQTDLYAGTDVAATIDTLVGELDALKDGAPDDVQAALTALGDGFRDAEELLANPTAENQKALADVGAELSAAGQKVTAYVLEQCR